MALGPIAKMRNTAYSNEYTEYVFWAWYKAGKPTATKLLEIIDAPNDGIKPTTSILNVWISQYFQARALELDNEVAMELQKGIIAEKVEMFRRHTDVAVELQHKALNFLRENDFRDAKTALAALLAGVDLEKQSRGIDKVLENVATRSNEQLMDDLRKIVSDSTSVQFFPLDDELKNDE